MASPHVLGREGELDAIGRFLDAPADAAAPALTLAGGAGAGKTTLWEVGVEAAADRGFTVLQARASGAEARLSFVTLADLLDGVGRTVLDTLPDPQRRALDVALLTAEPGAEPPELRAVATAFLSVLRAAAQAGALLVAVDDVQWLDAESAAALAFAARRLGTLDVRLLLAERADPGGAAALDVRSDRIEVGPLDRAAVRRLLAHRLDLALPRRVLDDVMRTSGGNPLFAIEIGRTLKRDGLPGAGERLTLPRALEEVVADRVAALPAEVRSLVLAAALSPLRRADLARLAPPGMIDAAIDHGALAMERDRVRLAHPLLGPAAVAGASAAEHRAMHLLLAAAATDETWQALHLAQAADGEDVELAEQVARAAATAAARGAAQDAADLGEHALRLTPADAPARPDRVLALAEHLLRAGQDERLTELLTVELPALPPGAPRVRAHLLLNDGGVTASVEGHVTRILAALEEASGDLVAAAPALADHAMTMAVAQIERIPVAVGLAEQAAEAAPAAGPHVELRVLRSLAWARSMQGAPVDDIVARHAAVANAARLPHARLAIDRLLGVRAAWRGDVERARRILGEGFAQAEEIGDVWMSIALRLHRCELELRAGGWDTVERMLDAWDEVADEAEMPQPLRERCRAIVAAGRGEPDAAERWAEQTLTASEESGVMWDRLEAWRVRGVAALAARDPAGASEWLGRVWDHLRGAEVDEPGVFPVAPDLVEALVEQDRAAEARSVHERLDRLARAQAHPWGLLGARRCAALLGDDPADLCAVADGYAERGLAFDAARTLLALGRAERRRRRLAAARAALVDAAAAFEAQGSPGWRQQAAEELERVGGRKPRSDPDALTPAERRVVELAAAGEPNKAIARTLVVSVHTVEGHLTRAYAKLGVRSRTELAAKDRGFPP